MRNGAVIDRTYRGDEKLDQAIIDKKEMQFLYTDGGRVRVHGQLRLRAADLAARGARAPLRTS